MVAVVLFGVFLWSRWAGADEGERFPFFFRLAIWSVILFVPWLFLNRWYVAVGDMPLRFLFALAGWPVDLPVERPLYSQTFNSVLFGSLVLAISSLSLRRRTVALGGGLVLLALGHQLFRLSYILFSACGVREAYGLSVAIHVLSGYLLPFLPWFALCRPKSMPPACRESGSENDRRTADSPGREGRHEV